MKFSGDKLSYYRKASEPLIKTPRSVQDTIEIMKISKSGIFEVKENRYTKSYIFIDINYITVDEAEQIHTFEKYYKFLNTMDIDFKITISNKNRNMKTLHNEILFKLKGDEFDEYREIYNSIMEQRIVEGKQGIEQIRYLTVHVERKNYEEAKAYFSALEANLLQSFSLMGSMLVPLDCKERLRVLHDFYCMGKEEDFDFEFDECKNKKADFKNDIANAMIQYHANYFETENLFGRALFIKKYPSALSDRFLSEMTNLPVHSITTIDAVPIPKDITTGILQKKYLGVESDIIRQQQKRNKNGDFSSDISYSKKKEKEDIEAIMDDVRDNDQCLFLVGVTIILLAETKEALESMTGSIKTIGKRNNCQIEVHYLTQREALNTALPIGVRQVQTLRTMLTQSLAVLIPFSVQELTEKGGEYYGINQVSKNVITGNRKKLINGNGFIFGVPGSGKSFFCKSSLGSVFLNTEDDIIIVDPQNEYFDVAHTFNGAVVNLSSYTKNYINPYDVPEAIEDMNAFIADKGELTLALAEQCMTTELNSRQKSIIDRCVRILYLEEYKKNKKNPTMIDLYHIFQRQKEEEAKDIALSFELFVTGSLNIFANPTNVNVDNRLVVYGIADLGKELSAISMLIMLENIGTRIARNALAGRATWLFLDEFHVLLAKEYSAKYLYGLWKKVRKQGGLCTGITQNVTDLLQNYTATTMLSNSEFVVLLKQSITDSQKLAKVLNVSEAQLKYVENSLSGTGIIKHGQTVVPFDNRISKDTKLYKLYNTNLHEKATA